MQRFVIVLSVPFRLFWATKATPCPMMNFWSSGKVSFTVSGWVIRLKGSSLLLNLLPNLFTIYLLKRRGISPNLELPCSWDRSGRLWDVNGLDWIVFAWTSITTWWRTYYINPFRWSPSLVRLKKAVHGVLKLSRDIPPFFLELFSSKIFCGKMFILYILINF